MGVREEIRLSFLSVRFDVDIWFEFIFGDFIELGGFFFNKVLDCVIFILFSVDVVLIFLLDIKVLDTLPNLLFVLIIIGSTLLFNNIYITCLMT